MPAAQGARLLEPFFLFGASASLEMPYRALGVSGRHLDPAGRHIRCNLYARTEIGRLRVLLSRCAWHRRYHGYPRVAGVVLWGGWGIRFTDGICRPCMRRFRAEHRAFIERRQVA